MLSIIGGSDRPWSSGCQSRPPPHGHLRSKPDLGVRTVGLLMCWYRTGRSHFHQKPEGLRTKRKCALVSTQTGMDRNTWTCNTKQNNKYPKKYQNVSKQNTFLDIFEYFYFFFKANVFVYLFIILGKLSLLSIFIYPFTGVLAELIEEQSRSARTFSLFLIR